MKSLFAVLMLALGALIASPVAAQMIFNDTTTMTSHTKTPEQAPGIAVGGAQSAGCDTFSIGASAPGVGGGISIPLPGKCRGLRDDGMALQNAERLAALTGNRAAGLHLAAQNPRLREAMRAAGVIRPEMRPVARSARAVPVNRAELTRHVSKRSGAPSEIVVIRSQAALNRFTAAEQVELCGGQRIKGSVDRREVFYELPRGRKCTPS